jgi:DUF4097 and DUF4098 domain-containing protein YvlB
VKVIGWNHSEVRVRGTRGGATTLDFATSGDRTTVRVRPVNAVEDDDEDERSAELEIHVPAGSTVEIKSVTAPVEVHDTTSVVRVESVSGDVSITGQPQEVVARTVAGDVEVDGPSADTHVRTVSGDIHLHGIRGKAHADSVSGVCDIHGSNFTEAGAQSVNGDVDFDGALDGDAAVDFRTHRGKVTVTLPSSTSAEMELHSINGAIESDLGGHRSGQRSLEFRAGSGDAHVRVRSFDGDIEVHEK